MRGGRLPALLIALTCPRVAAARGDVLIGARAVLHRPAGGGYVDHARAFGFSGLDSAGGWEVEAGYALAPRLTLAARLGSQQAQAEREDRKLGREDVDHLRLQRTAAAGLVRVTALRHAWTARDTPDAVVRLDLAAGAGWYRIGERFDGAERSAGGPGGLLGADLSLHVGWFGIAAGYARHMARASLSDRIGGRVSAGGHAFGIGASLRF